MATKNILITGANRGLGLGFVRHYLGPDVVVFAGARDPEGARELLELQRTSPHQLNILPLDISSENHVREAANQFKQLADNLDILINNAGRYGQKHDVPLEELNVDDLHLTVEVNTFGPLRVSRAFLPFLKKGNEKKLIHITSLMGSIADNSSGNAYGYRISKAALNMLNRNLAHELKPHGICSVALHPGWVKTDMGGENAPLSIDESISGMTQTIQLLTLDQTGAFLRYDGSPCAF